MSTLSKKPPDHKTTTIISPFAQKPTFLGLLRTTSGKFICLSSFLLYHSSPVSLNPFSKSDGGIVTVTTLSNLFQEVMSSNCLGLPSLPTSAHCCAILGQHTRISSISVPPSSFIHQPPFNLALKQRASSYHDWSAQCTAFESATLNLRLTYALQRRNDWYV